MQVESGSGLRGRHKRSVDVVVVGSGAGGAVAAYNLAKAGLETLVLEAGPHVRPQEFTQRELDTVRRVYVEQGAQGPSDGSIAVLQGRCVGGSTVVNGEVCFRTPQFVLDEWANDYGIRGLSAEDLEPAFVTVEEMINVTPNEGEYLGAGERLVAGLTKLGWSPKPISRNVKGCVGCPYCFFGCAFGCKQSMDQSYLPAAYREGARIIDEAHVDRIQFSGRRAESVVATTPNGRLEVRAKTVVVACGAVHTPSILMAHKLGGPDVGRHLAVHPVFFASGLFDTKKKPVMGMLSSYSDHFLEDNILIEVGSGSKAFGAAGMPGFGREHMALVKKADYVHGGGAIVRDVTGPGRVRRTRKGKTVVDYKPDQFLMRTTRKALKAIIRMQLAAGAQKAWLATTIPHFFRSERDIEGIDTMPLGPADIASVAYHPQSSARMGAVTDMDGRVHETDNLYVMDTSLFPTPVGVNPQVSVMAVVTLLAQRLGTRMS